MASILRRTLLVSLIAVVSVLAIGTWLLTMPLPEIQTPPIDEARDVATDEVLSYRRALYEHLDEELIESTSPNSDEIYRLILLPTFHEPVIVIITKNEEKLQISTKVFDGVGGYGLEKMGKLSLSEMRILSMEEFEQFQARLDEARYWEQPVRDQQDIAVNDGALWLLEGRDHGVVRSVERITPKPKLLEVFRFILRLAGREEKYKGYWPARPIA